MFSRNNTEGEELIEKNQRAPDPLKNAIAGELMHNQGWLHSSRLLARVWNDAPGGRGLMIKLLFLWTRPDKVRVRVIEGAHQGGKIN